MDFSALSIPQVGWASAIALALALAGAILIRQWTRADKHEREAKDEIEKAEAAYRLAVDSRDVDRIRLAAVRLQNARKRAGKT
jgi:hypothetical protein